MDEDARRALTRKAQEVDAQRKAQGEGPLTRDHFTDLTGIPRTTIETAFDPGGWGELVKAAHIRPHPNAHGRFGDNPALLVKLHALAKEKKKIPLVKEFAKYVGITRSSIHRRFRADGGVVKAYRKWLIENEPASPFLELLATKPPQKPPNVPRTSRAESAVPSRERKAARQRRIPVNPKEHDETAHIMEKVGKAFGFETLWKPSVNRLRPDKKSFGSKDKTLDLAWRIDKHSWVPIEIQIAGSVGDLIYRFAQVHHWSNRLVVISSERFTAEIKEAIAESQFREKVVILSPDEVLTATKSLDGLLELRMRIFES